MPVTREHERTDINEVLADLAAQYNPSYRPSPKGDPFRVKDPEQKYQFCWLNPEEADSVFERGGELVPKEENGYSNLEKYSLVNRAKTEGNWIYRRGLILGRIPNDVYEQEQIGVVLDTYNNLGHDVGLLNDEADVANTRDHGALGKGLASIPRTRNVPEHPAVEARGRKVTRDKNTKRLDVDDALEMDANDALKSQGLTREDIETEE